MKLKAFRPWKRLWNERALSFDEVEPLLGPMASPLVPAGAGGPSR